MGAPITAFSAVIASGEAVSDAVELGDNRLFAIQMPSGWTTAGLTFQASYDGVTYVNLYESEGTEVAVTAAASVYIVIQNPARWLGINFSQAAGGKVIDCVADYIRANTTSGNQSRAAYVAAGGSLSRTSPPA